MDDDIPIEDQKALQADLRRMKEDNKNKLNISETWAYKVFIKSAYRLLHKPLAILDLAKKGIAHIQQYDSVRELAAEAREQLGTIFRLVQAYAQGNYRQVSTRNLVFSLAALMYLVSPFDLIPDFLAAGLLDDITLIVWVYNNFRTEMEQFREWEDRDKVKIEIQPKE